MIHDIHVILWKPTGLTMLKKRNSFMDGFRKWELHAPKEASIPSEACSFGDAAVSLIADERIRQLSIVRGYSDRDDIDSMSSGSMSPDLGDTWHQGLEMSPQWEGGLELYSGNDCEHETENEDDGRYEEFDSAAESDPKDYISEASESSRRSSIRDCLTLSDILVFAYSRVKVE